MNNALTASLFTNFVFLFLQIRKLLFAGKFYVVFIVVIAVFNGFPIIVGHIINEPLEIEATYYMMNMIPGIVLALFLSMFLVSYEKDNKTIEALFSIPGSPYKIWLYKLTVQYFILLILQVLFAIMTFLFVDSIPIAAVVVNAFANVFFAGNLTFFFSTKLKSGIAAGIVAFVILMIFMPVSIIFIEETDSMYKWALYLNPLMKPDNLDIGIWNQRLLYNKLVIYGLGILFMYRGLTNLRKREPFI